jgi:hypothetical protein
MGARSEKNGGVVKIPDFDDFQRLFHLFQLISI